MYSGKKRNRKEVRYDEDSIFDVFGFYIILIAGVILFIIGVRHINDTDIFGVLWGKLCLMEAGFAFVGIIGVMTINAFVNEEFRIIPRFKQFELKTFLRAFFLFGIIYLVQVIFQIVPLTIESLEMGIGIVSAGPAEESLFRGFMLLLFIEMGKKKSEYKPVFDIIGCVSTSLIFAMIHVNYYGNIANLGIVFVSGLVYSFFILKWKDLTACVLAHLFINAWSVGQWLLFL